MTDAPVQTIHVEKFPYQKIPQIASRDLAYIESNPQLAPFYKYEPRIASFAETIADKGLQPVDRALLVQTLKKQYDKLPSSATVDLQIGRLISPETFTVTTAHQPCLFTGPLYFIYKIISTINLAECLQKSYPNQHFVPVFVIGGEDHDFAEVNHFHLFGKKLQWESSESGSVGSMHTSSLLPVLDTLKSILGESENAQKIYTLLHQTHTQFDVYAEAVQALVHQLFQRFGLVVLNMNEAALKKKFIPIMEDELLRERSFKMVGETIQQLEEAGFHGQANPREINLFYLGEGFRERIIREGDRFEVLNTELSFSKEEILRELHERPERFSPNVILRPLYQELILPNLAYVGGGGEIAYWLERKSQFDAYGLNFPVLVRRNSVLWIDAGLSKRLQKLQLHTEQLFQETDQLIRWYIAKNAEEELSLLTEKKMLESVFENIADIAQKVDPTLVKSVMAEASNQLKVIDQLESRLVRAEKQKHETALNQLRSIREKLFPNNGLQERYDNFLPFYLKHGELFFDILKQHLNPFDAQFLILTESDQL